VTQQASTADIAAALATAFQSADLDRLGQVLAPDVRWGGSTDTELTCHTSAEVLAWYERLREAGVRATVDDVTVLPSAVIVALHIAWPVSTADRPDRIWQVCQVRDGLVVDIRGFPDPALALDHAGTLT
jgi:ketosteroid isomerase-like protein